MGKPTGFKAYERELPQKRPVADRLKDYKEFYLPFPRLKCQAQAARCMDCGVPTCHAGCPLGNLIPDWNERVYRDRWREAAKHLALTNNFPEFTGRLCPAPCEEACVLGINTPAVTIEQIEKQIVEHAFDQGWVRPIPPLVRSGKRVAVIGSGPAGLAAAQQLNRVGHRVTLFERHDRIGGLLRYGIPDFKMEKWVIDRRLDLMAKEGIVFQPGTNVGVDITADDLKAFDAMVMSIGSTVPRDLPIPGRELDGVHFAMDFLIRQNRIVAGDDLAALGHAPISAAGKDVVVIGGGDTGSDCIGTSNRQGAKSVTNFELLPKPTAHRPDDQPWPYWPVRMRPSSSHEEGCRRHWQVLAKSFVGEKGRVSQVVTVDVAFVDTGGGPPALEEIEGSERKWPADLVVLAMGFVGPETGTIVDQLGIERDGRGNIRTDGEYMTNVPGVFASGDARRGQSLVVWAISEGRETARCVDRYLMGSSDLPTKGGGDLPRVP